MPYFSVVIPTFNRAHLLPLAVRSVMEQSFEDFEIVISNGGSTDNTADVIGDFHDDRIVYIESERRLLVGDNYQQGLENASGEFITFLSDDDAYTPNLLQRVKDVLDETKSDIVGYQYCRYYHDDLIDFDRAIPKNSLLISRFDSQVTQFSSSEALDQVMAIHGLSSMPVDPRFICPYLSNATYRKSIFESLRRRRKNLFDMVPADIYLATAVFFETETYFCLDEPLLVWSNWEGNSTASAQRTENKVSEHYRRLLNGHELKHTPLKFPLALNCGANAVIEAMRDSDWNGTIDWVSYFAKTYENFIFLRSVGIDTRREETEFKAALKLQPAEIRRLVDARLSGVGFVAKEFLNSRLPTIAAKLRRLTKVNKPDQMRLVKGASEGFTNVLEASRCVI